MWCSVVFYQTPGLEVTACVLLSTKAVYFVLHDGLRRYFSEPLQGRHQGLLAPRSSEQCLRRQAGLCLCSQLCGFRQQRFSRAGRSVPCLRKGVDNHALSWSCHKRPEARA